MLGRPVRDPTGGEAQQCSDVVVHWDDIDIEANNEITDLEVIDLANRYTTKFIGEWNREMGTLRFN